MSSVFFQPNWLYLKLKTQSVWKKTEFMWENVKNLPNHLVGRGFVLLWKHRPTRWFCKFLTFSHMISIFFQTNWVFRPKLSQFGWKKTEFMWENVKNWLYHLVGRSFHNETKPWKTFHCAETRKNILIVQITCEKQDSPGNDPITNIMANLEICGQEVLRLGVDVGLGVVWDDWRIEKVEKAVIFHLLSDGSNVAFGLVLLLLFHSLHRQVFAFFPVNGAPFTLENLKSKSI